MICSRKSGLNVNSSKLFSKSYTNNFKKANVEGGFIRSE